MHERFAVAMQVEHDIGIDRQPQQRVADMVDGPQRLARRQCLDQSGADERHVGCRVVAETAAHGPGRGVC